MIIPVIVCPFTKERIHDTICNIGYCPMVRGSFIHRGTRKEKER